MAKHRTRVGVHARNDVSFTEADYQLIRQARIETLKTMSHTGVGVYQRVRRENPGLEFIVRLFDDRARTRSRPTPAQFVERMLPIINSLKPYVTKFEIHNEPNHVDGLEGWGPTDADARSFLDWYMQVIQSLKRACPWARFGFPGLAPNYPHRDLQWLTICRPAVLASHWLGFHGYWQYGNMLSDEWGLRFKQYHQRFPNHTIEITEFGDATPNLSPDEMAQRYVRYYAELSKYFYVHSASSFIASSADPAWAPFAWMREGGHMLPVVHAVGTMVRKEVDVVIKRVFEKTGKTVSGDLLAFLDRYGLDLFGQPITQEAKEGGIPSQYFENVGMESPKAGQVRLKPLGTEVLAGRTKISQLGTQVGKLQARVVELEAQVEELEDQIDRLSAEPPPDVETVLEKLSRLVESLDREIQALSQEAVRREGQPQPYTVAPSAMTSIQELVKAMTDLNDDLRKELEATMARHDKEQASLIEKLRARIAELEKLLEPKEKATPAPKATPRPALRDITTTLIRHPTERYDTRPLTDIQLLVIHHSATVPDVAINTIARYHVEKWHWPGIGYHFVVASDGTLYQTNDVKSLAFHTSVVNETAVGICFLGSFMDAGPPQAQIQAGAQLVAWLLQELKLDASKVVGHRELMATACPGNQWLSGAQWKRALLNEVSRIQAG